MEADDMIALTVCVLLTAIVGLEVVAVGYLLVDAEREKNKQSDLNAQPGVAESGNGKGVSP